MLRNTGVPFGPAPLSIASIDYLRFTFPEPLEEVWRLSVVRTAWSVADAHHQATPRLVWSKQGYRGLKQGPVYLGVRRSDMMLEVSGYTAHHMAWALALPDQWRAARFDLAITAWYDSDEGERIARAADLAVLHRETDHRRRRMKIELRDGKGSGNTLYLGAKTSLEQGRFYDKYRQSKQDAAFTYALRYEVEYHNESALRVAEQLLTSANPEKHIVATVKRWFEERGVPCPVDATEELAISSRIPRDASPDEKTLEWIRKGVGPSVRRLLTAGKERAILQALGCSGSLTPLVLTAPGPQLPEDPRDLTNYLEEPNDE